MCSVCKNNFSVQEKIAAHDYDEQMRAFRGLTLKMPKKPRLTKKSLLMKIENELMKLQAESKHAAELVKLKAQKIDDLDLINEQFRGIMLSYYEEKLKEELSG
jgi:hypothetical protein